VANTASELVAARCGYVREGVLRSGHVKDGIRADRRVVAAPLRPAGR
jgi:RimJ/RimL family protein N-acetyltransferase